MPELATRNPQRGSILVTVIGLSIAMTAAALGFLNLASNSAVLQTDSFSNTKAFYGAESGLMLGMRWCNAYDTSLVKKASWVNDFTLTKAADGTPGWADFEGVKVKVVMNQPGDGTPPRWISSYAFTAEGRDTVKLIIQIDGAEATVVPGDLSMLKDYPKLWREFLRPGR